MMTVFLNGFEVLCVDILVGVFEQRALKGLLYVPGIWPWFEVLLNGFRDTTVMRRHNLGTVLPVHLGSTQKIYDEDIVGKILK